MRVLVVGSGISGATFAAMMVREGHEVLVMDERQVVAGNCHDYEDRDTGVMVHKYGPHAFHTKSVEVFDFLKGFASFYGNSLRIMARLQSGAVVPIPYNEMTRKIVGEWSDEDMVREIMRPYSEKMWGMAFEQIPKEITNRAPRRREGYDDRWHVDSIQALPSCGYTQMVEAMLEGCEVWLGADKDAWRKVRDKYDLVAFTGKLDEYFNLCFGELAYRSLEFSFMHTAERLQTMQQNECNTLTKITRTIDHGYWYPHDETRGTVWSQERPCAHVRGENDPLYPMAAFPDMTERTEQYRTAAKKENGTVFIGRLANYKYLDMDAAIALSMKAAKHILT